MHALIQFAATGSPATREIHWPAWTPDEQRYLVIGDGVQVASMRPKQMDWLARHPVVLRDAPAPGKSARD